MVRYIHEDFGDGLWSESWTGVDVKREDGLLQHGTLVDVSSSGLVVDMGCAGQRQQLVPYGQAFQCPWYFASRRACALPLGSAVLVLLRATRDGPWLWQSATLRAIFSSSQPYHGYHPLALVALHGGPQEMVVAGGQLRVPPSPKDRQALVIQQGDFVRRDCALPDYGGWRPATDSPVWQLAVCAQRDPWVSVRPLFVDGNWLVYLQLADAEPLDCGTLKSIIDRGQSTVVKCKKAKGVDFWADGWRCRMLRVQTVEEADAVNLQHIPAEILVEVFHHSSSMDRVQQRRVCRRFNGILTETQLKDIIIRCGTCPVLDLRVHRRRCGEHGEVHAVIGSLVKCLTRSVKHIIITDNSGGKQEHGRYAVCRALEVLNTISTLGLADHGPLVVMAGNCELVGTGIFRVEVHYLALVLRGADYAGICSTLLLHNCTVQLSRSAVRVSGVISARSAEVDLWEVVEKTVPVVNIPPIVTWVARAVVQQSNDRKETIQVMEAFGGDPRASRDDDDEDDWAGVDVTKLSILCRYALSLLIPPNGPNVFQLLPFAEDL